MISVDILKQVILDNQHDVERQIVIPRSVNLEEGMNYVLVGVRRAGKSFMLYQRMQQNLQIFTAIFRISARDTALFSANEVLLFPAVRSSVYPLPVHL